MGREGAADACGQDFKFYFREASETLLDDAADEELEPNEDGVDAAPAAGREARVDRDTKRHTRPPRAASTAVEAAPHVDREANDSPNRGPWNARGEWIEDLRHAGSGGPQQRAIVVDRFRSFETPRGFLPFHCGVAAFKAKCGVMSKTPRETEQTISAAYAHELNRLQPDDALGALSDIGEPLGISVLVKGLVVSGTIARRGPWLDAFERIDTEGKVSEVVNGAFRERWGMVDADLAAHDPENDDVEPPYDPFLHLVDAAVFSGHQRLPSDTRLPIRIRLSEIDGWMIGTLRDPS
ncbi:hypothetical protein [Nocardioides sp. KR10-350]|uniref:hypothetical protein n=1 Tax=Nocardioides cheoyonin TaxID=3156615 RepID=UPI0032B3396A